MGARRPGGLWCDKDFADWYPRDGRPGLSPARLATVCVLQFLLGLSDWQAAEVVRCRIDFTYAMAMGLDERASTTACWPTSVTVSLKATVPTASENSRPRVSRRPPDWCASAPRSAPTSPGKAHIQHVLTAIAVNIERLSGLPPAEETLMPDDRPPSSTTSTSARYPG
ncbi:transposase [Streptomyces spongiicola]|uniref:transposase n=1 Tax=Streptomyces spongiicola TaxID=1690221 RepID=UPI0021CF5AC2|nr:transposase [Streptomyces spongiicola]